MKHSSTIINCKPPLQFILHTKLCIYTLVCKKSVKFPLCTQIYIPNCTNNIWYVKFKQNSVRFFSLYIPKCIIKIWYVFIANLSFLPKQNTYQTSNFAIWYVNNHWTFLFEHKTYIPNCTNNIWYVFATKRHKIFKNMHIKLFFFSSSCINFHFWGNYIYRDFFPI